MLINPDVVEGAGTSEVTTSQTTTSTSYVDLATVQSFDVIVGASGKLLVSWAGQISNSGSNGTYMAPALSGANTYAATDNDLTYWLGTSNSVSSRSKLFTGLTPGLTTVTLKFKVDGGTGTWLRRSILGIPL